MRVGAREDYIYEYIFNLSRTYANLCIQILIMDGKNENNLYKYINYIIITYYRMYGHYKT